MTDHRLARPRPSRERDLEQGLRFAGLLLASATVMSVLKVVVGLLTGSHALLANALYSINDVLSSIAVSIGLRVSARRPDAEHSYGYGNAEFIAVGIVSLSIAIGVFLMFGVSLIDILPGVDKPPHFTAISLAAVSMVTSWYLSRRAHHLAIELESPALSTSADHHHADASGSLLAIIGVTGALLGFHVLDRIVAIIETLHVVELSGALLARSVKGLMDTALPEEDIELIESACLRVRAVRRVVWIRSRRVGTKAWVDVAVAVPGDLPVHDAHSITEQVRRAIHRVLGPGAMTQVRFQGPDCVEALPGPGGSPRD